MAAGELHRFIARPLLVDMVDSDGVGLLQWVGELSELNWVVRAIGVWGSCEMKKMEWRLVKEEK